MYARVRPAVAALLCLLAGLAAAAGPDPEPVTVVRDFYARDSVRAYEFYSARLRALFVASESPSEEAALDFAFHSNGQDVEEGWRSTLVLELVSSSRDRALVRATFRNFGPQEVRFMLVREGGRWLIDDAESVGPDRWLLSRLLDRGR